MKRGRPRKTAAPKTDKALAAAPAQTAPEAVSKPSEPKTDKETDKLAEALQTALRPLLDELKEHMTICARLAAADTVRTMQSSDKVLRDAIAEGQHSTTLIATALASGHCFAQ